MEVSTESLYYQSRIANRIKRHDDVIKFMNQLVLQKPLLNPKERDLLFTGYKDSIDSIRSTINLLDDVLMNETEESDMNSQYSSEDPVFEIIQSRRIELAKYIDKYIENLMGICKEAIDLIDTVLLPGTTENESLIYYYKTRADYLRYMAEFKEEQERESIIKQSELSYQTALHLAQSNKHLKKSDPLYLGLALNFAVCEVEFMSKKKEVIAFTEAVFKEAVKTLDELDEEKYAEAANIMQLIRDNITQWSNLERNSKV